MNEVMADINALNDILSRYLTPREVAMELGVTRGRVQQMMTEGKLSYATTPYGRIIPKMGLEQFKSELDLKKRQACPICGRYCREVATCAS
jgi:predicted site-specific integrase-resolvase